MSHSSFNQRLKVNPFVVGIVLGLLPLLLFCSTYIRISPLYPRHLLLQHLSFTICSADPSAGGRSLEAEILYIIEWLVWLFVAVEMWWSKKSGKWVYGLFIALVLDVFVFVGIIYCSLIYCPWHLVW